MEYWKECISEAFDEAGISATDEQISAVAKFVSGAHENYGLAHGYECIPSPLEEENKKFQCELESEKSKISCPDCKGSGEEVSAGPVHSSWSRCFRCRGEGRIKP